MSNFFESLRKAELIGSAEFPLTAPENTGLAVEAKSPPGAARSDRSSTTAHPAPLSHELNDACRTASLRVSKSAPVLLFEEEGQGLATEEYRLIRTKILHHPSKPKMLVVSSSGSGDGKTVTAINLSAAFALKAGSRVALIDADMRHPQVASYLGLSVSPGLTEVLTGATTFEKAALCIQELPNLWVLPAGEQHQNQAELLESDRWRQFVHALRQNFDYVIFDAPPAGAVADYDSVQLAADGVIFVARPDYSRRGACIETLETIPKQKLLGVVLNCVEPWFLWRRKRYGYYRYEQPAAKAS